MIRHILTITFDAAHAMTDEQIEEARSVLVGETGGDEGMPAGRVIDVSVMRADAPRPLVADHHPGDVEARYQRCFERIWDLFPTDPLGDDPAHFYVERLEALLNRGLLAPAAMPSAIDAAAKGLDDHALAGMLECLANAVDRGVSPDEDLRRHVREARNRARWLRERAEAAPGSSPAPIALKPEEWPCTTCRGAIVKLTTEVAALRKVAEASQKWRHTPFVDASNSTSSWARAEREWRDAVDALPKGGAT